MTANHSLLSILPYFCHTCNIFLAVLILNFIYLMRKFFLSYENDKAIKYGINSDAPLDRAAIERAFDKALIQLSLGRRYETASSEEKESARKE
jgi:hypothetical protein